MGATRGFYSSLLQENPNSKIAIKYAIEYGLLPLDEHNKLLKKYNKLKDAGEYSIGAKTKKMLEEKAMEKAKMKGNLKPKIGGKENKENEKIGEKKEKKDKDGKEGKDKK